MFAFSPSSIVAEKRKNMNIALIKRKEKKMKVPVIVMTNLNQEEDRKRASDLGAASFFVKSNSPISLIVETVKNKIHSS